SFNGNAGCILLQSISPRCPPGHGERTGSGTANPNQSPPDHDPSPGVGATLSAAGAGARPSAHLKGDSYVKIRFTHRKPARHAGRRLGAASAARAVRRYPGAGTDRTAAVLE